METDTEETKIDPYLVVLGNGLLLLSKLEQLNVEYGMADCLLTNPYVVTPDGSLEQWMPHAEEEVIPIKSDSILTILTPKESLLKRYLEII